MTSATDLKHFFVEGRPLIEQALDIAEQFKAFRDAAREKDIDWSQVKALLKAQILDERDGEPNGKRVRAIIDKADNASAYADMLGLGAPEKNFSREISENPDHAPEAAQKPTGAFLPPDSASLEIPSYLDRRVERAAS